MEKVTSYDNATVGSGSVVNQLVRQYNDLGQLTREYQEHDGLKDANTPYIEYTYDESADGGEFTKGLRLKSIRYPDGRLLHYTYGTGGSMADVLHRVDAIKDDNGSGSPGTTVPVSYQYLGPGTVAIADYKEPELKLDYDSGTANAYAGLDRFGRVVDHLWSDYGASTDAVRVKHGYDRASNRQYREDAEAASQSVHVDEYYTYDGLYRLVNFDRGNLTGSPPSGISGTPAREQDWTLDSTGNWSSFVEKTSGTTDFAQDRVHNEVNEITDIIGYTSGASSSSSGTGPGDWMR